MTRHWVKLGLLICGITFLIGCGGGGSSGNTTPPPPGPTPPPPPPPPPADPFGLTMRAPLANLNLPFSAGGGLGTYQVVNAFPNLNFSDALFLAGVPQENRLVVVQQSGFIQAFENASSTSISRTILDLSGRISFGGEEGLLGFAFDPAFAQNRYIYVHYSMNPPRRSVISRFTWDQGQDAVIVGSEKIILEVSQPATNHNGGMLAFGPDDFLYIAFGDGGSSGDPNNNAQNTTNLLGSMLRIDVHPQNPSDAYDIPADNPFIAANDGIEDEIWAYGLRNPFRFSFDRQNGDLWLGDVGQLAFEEIDIITRGGNYGWRVFEGNADFDGSANSLPRSAFTFPVFEYGRDEGIAVIGGYVYRGTDISSLQGRYLFSDFGSGTIWAITYNGTSVVSNDQLTSANRPTSFGEDNQGEVYVVTQGGSIFNLEETTPGGGNLPVLLSQTGVFTNLANLTPASGLIEYDVTLPFWSDGTTKRRWLAVPDGQTITFSDTNSWQFPQGTVLVKHFELLLTEGDVNSARRLETRLLIRTSTAWEGYTYRWNSNETDATLLTGRESETITVNLAGGSTRDQQYDYPSRPDCLSCHNQTAGFALSAITRQLNRDFVYPNVTDNQLRSLNNIDLFSTDIGSAANFQSFPALNDTAVNVEQRARAYLDVNCAQCHQPGGGTPASIDLRVDTAASAMNTVSVSPQAGDLGLTNAAIIQPGSKEQSTLWERLRRTDNNRMPPISSHVVDDLAVSVVGDWIDSL